ncbi:glyoxylase-like metal-dependent hydrolase (beta-lactamase superfamily II) [Altererythrobacter atlanticus]|uniref:N-acyl homoserine lactonase n=1 Tax=Croceibacterium atlanticum TaxID=1267766 RepID=A0A0F7KUA0_9SPHN|nr:N-acyl homoserine lactonase family protein [Croceibacterium atlanticum]AKH43184.1 N-acyl homoserine lactonase [Croceibacterium atlanticum]MBB5732111.1 glyoxylase-like metal-dependent hydrolase (beta-lactamase superfamily II) [Croceibacterium atlanticum]
MPASVTRIDAIRYARHDRSAAGNFSAPVDDHDLPMPLDYYIWAIHRDGQPPVIVDTGFGEAAALARGRIITRPVLEGLRDAGIDHLLVQDVILTHLHYDHAGSLGTFPNARFHIQDAELTFATGRQICDHGVRAPFDGEPVAEIVRKLYAGHVVFHDGDEDFAPDIQLRLASGHTAGLQMVCCETARGLVVLASDAAHLYANLTRRLPFPIFVDEGEYRQSQQRALELAGNSLAHLIPGHDPLVLACFPAENDIARVDLPPHTPIPEGS